MITCGDVWRGALFSDDFVHRYKLWFHWADGPVLPWVMYNPSTADHIYDDPTVRRCFQFSKREGYGGADIYNMFAFRSPYPKQLNKVSDPVGPQNDDVLSSIQYDTVVVAWGSTPYRYRAARTLDILTHKTLLCLGTCKDGSPRHPLYLKASQPLIPYVLSSNA